MAIDSAHTEWAPRAALNLGILLTEQKDIVGARGAFQQAIDSGHADLAPLAALNLGVLLDEQGDVAGARAALHRAERTDFHSPVRREASAHLRRLGE